MFCLQMLKTIASIYISGDINICANFKSKIWKVNLKSKISIFAISSIASRQQYICSSEEEILFLTNWEYLYQVLKWLMQLSPKKIFGLTKSYEHLNFQWLLISYCIESTFLPKFFSPHYTNLFSIFSQYMFQKLLVACSITILFLSFLTVFCPLLVWHRDKS